MSFTQPDLPPIPPDVTFAGKTILITGASAGIGLAAATQFLVRHASEVIMAVRDPAKGEKMAKAGIRSRRDVQRENPAGKISVMKLDLEDFPSVVGFADAVKRRYDAGGLDVLLLNAGFGSLKWEICESSGHEKMVQVNLLSPALLAVELLPLLERTAARNGSRVPSRLTWVGSFVQSDHSFARVPLGAGSQLLLERLDNRELWTAAGALSRYPDSKLLGTMFVAQLAQRVDSGKVVVNDVSPGMVMTGFGDYPAWLRAMYAGIPKETLRSVDDGANTYLHATGVVGEESHGKYLSDEQIADRAPIFATEQGKVLQEKLWDEIWEECLKVDEKLQRPVRN